MRGLILLFSVHIIQYNLHLLPNNLSLFYDYLGKIFDDLELTDHGGSNKEGMYQMNCQVLRCLIAHPTSKSQYNNLSSTYIDISQR